MRSRKWIGAAAAAGLTTVAAAGLAFAQERQEKAPATQQMEKGAMQRGAAGATEKGAIERRQSAQAQSPGEERLRQGGGQEKTGQEKMGQEKMGQEGMKPGEEGKAAQTEKMNGEQGAGRNNQTNAQGEQNKQEKGAAAGQQTGQAKQPEEKGKTAAQGQTPANENRAEMQNNRQGEGHNAQGANERHVSPQNVRVEGNTHITKENASRIADSLMATFTSQNVNVNVNVGAPLPGDVRLLPLPANVVDLVPEYRGYDYVVVNDEIVIVQPSTRNVVEIINTGGAATAMAATHVNPCGP